MEITDKNNDFAQNLLIFSISFFWYTIWTWIFPKESTSAQLEYLQLFLLLFSFISVIFVILFFFSSAKYFFY